MGGGGNNVRLVLAMWRKKKDLVKRTLLKGANFITMTNVLPPPEPGEGRVIPSQRGYY